ncbi:MbcA/ParS/Xre antitoxin family protein [Neptunomonas japonica]|uniref:MbcA/ParS/Xre antitoxin family protein n=1 Tax=Neptunomonas japonica TaxID=417574 RepID=UPI00042466C7|nr:antitoxin Xre/MbcA/ParS toxin-binding domain-containing protein [Neptunomonas japonica]
MTMFELSNIAEQDLITARKIVSRILQNHWSLSERQIEDLFFFEEEVIVISRVFNIYRALRELFQNEQQADSWIHKSNKAFGGIIALEIMISDSNGLKKVQDYVCSQLV